MLGMLLWKAPGEGKSEVRERLFLHMRFICGEVARGTKTPELVLRRRVLAAGKKMRKRGIVRAVLPEGFAYMETLGKCGIRPVSTLPLRRLLAADWTKTALAEQGYSSVGIKVAISAGQLTGEVVRAVTELSLRYRYVLLDLPYGGEELCRQLQREYGVSLLLGPSREQLDAADALLLFHARGDLKGKNPVVLRLYDEEAPMPGLSLPPALEEQLPQGMNQGQLLAALQEAGVLRAGEIALHTGS